MQWYEELFKNFAESYENEDFTKGTIGEADFLEKEFDFDKSIKILDIGCGTGRHSIELAKRGYNLTGLDLSESMLKKAKANALKANVQIDFICSDARTFHFPEKFDAAIMLCEGGFSLMETDEMNFKILSNVYNSLKPGSKFIFSTLNGLFPLFHSVKEFINNGTSATISKNNSFDLMTFRDYSDYEIIDDEGNKKTLKCNERYYVPSEITWLLSSLGFSSVEIFGCELGNFSRNKKLSTEDYEMLVITVK